MKLFRKVLFVLILLLALVGCGAQENNNNNQNQEQKQEPEKAVLSIVLVKNNGEDDEIVTVDNAETFQFPTVTKEGYELVKWYSDDEFYDEFTLEGINVDALTKDVELYAYAKWKICNYKVSFVANGQVLKSQYITYGKSATAPTAPEVSGKTFIGWDQEYNFIKSELTINAIYEDRPLAITYINLYDGSEITNLNVKEYMAGDEVELPVPTIEGFEFEGWYLSKISLYKVTKIDSTYNQDLTLYGRFNETIKHTTYVLPSATYRITSINKVPNGNNTFVYQPVLPSSAPSGLTNYDWTTSDESIATCSQYSTIFVRGAGICVITGTYQKDKNITVNCFIKITADGPEYITEEQANNFITHTVTFKDNNGNVIKTETVTDGGAAIYPVAPKVDGYSFTGWDKDCYNIKVDTIITATYKQNGENNYQGKKFAFIGDSISTFKNYIPDGFSCFYPYATGDTNDVNQTWWMQTINKLGGQLFVNNSYSGSCVCGNGGSAAETDGRLAYTLLQGQTPDVIIIYMGSNDAHAKYDIASSYRKMLEKLKVLCPNAEIILMELPISNLYTNETKDNYNIVINKLGEEYGYKVIKMGEETLVPYLIDSAHPYTSGMTMIANNIVGQLTK